MASQDRPPNEYSNLPPPSPRYSPFPLPYSLSLYLSCYRFLTFSSETVIGLCLPSRLPNQSRVSHDEHRLSFYEFREKKITRGEDNYIIIQISSCLILFVSKFHLRCKNMKNIYNEKIKFVSENRKLHFCI